MLISQFGLRKPLSQHQKRTGDSGVRDPLSWWEWSILYQKDYSPELFWFQMDCRVGKHHTCWLTCKGLIECKLSKLSTGGRAWTYCSCKPLLLIPKPLEQIIERVEIWYKLSIIHLARFYHIRVCCWQTDCIAMDNMVEDCWVGVRAAFGKIYGCPSHAIHIFTL